ncbi:MAG: aminopeptidase P family protein [Verrucomicrobia bacterium]|nr:aminopeptidase P family protein [Verrucomicrobiota bacterium]
MPFKNPSAAKRLLLLQSRIKETGCDACLIETPTNLHYFTGLDISLGKLLVHKDAAALFVDGRYIQVAKEKAPMPAFLDGQHEVRQFGERQGIKKLALDALETSVAHFDTLRKEWQGFAELVPLATFFRTLRAIKDEEEIGKMRASAALLWQGFEKICSLLKEGITERQLAKAFEIFCLEKGADGPAFEPIIAFGKNSAMPHYRSADVSLKKGDTVLIDIGTTVAHYRSDMTRVLFFGQADPEIQRLYEITERAQKSALACALPGVALKELDLAARAVFKEEKVEELFLHSLGHGIGLETHEFPRIKWDNADKDVLLEKGMVITVEPGLYLPGKGGVRYEDTIVITEKGHENFYSR